MSTVRCPDSWHLEPPLQGPLYVVGCGHEFAATPDHENLIDCPNCGMWFAALPDHLCLSTVEVSSNVRPVR